MTILPILITGVAKRIHHLLREIAYDDMARQASGWIPEDARVENSSREHEPITLDFDIPKRRRLNWISRNVNHLPH